MEHSNQPFDQLDMHLMTPNKLPTPAKERTARSAGPSVEVSTKARSSTENEWKFPSVTISSQSLSDEIGVKTRAMRKRSQADMNGDKEASYQESATQSTKKRKVSPSHPETVKDSRTRTPKTPPQITLPPSRKSMPKSAKQPKSSSQVKCSYPEGLKEVPTEIRRTPYDLDLRRAIDASHHADARARKAEERAHELEKLLRQAGVQLPETQMQWAKFFRMELKNRGQQIEELTENLEEQEMKMACVQGQLNFYKDDAKLVEAKLATKDKEIKDQEVQVEKFFDLACKRNVVICEKDQTIAKLQKELAVYRTAEAMASKTSQTLQSLPTPCVSPYTKAVSYERGRSV